MSEVLDFICGKYGDLYEGGQINYGHLEMALTLRRIQEDRRDASLTLDCGFEVTHYARLWLR